MFRCPSLMVVALSACLANARADAQSAADRPAPERPRAGGAGGAVAQTPTLVVFLTVDQLRPDYFSRFGPQLTGGLERLYDSGAVFTDAHQDHATTETAPGHASTMSGRFPSHTGIVRNNAGVIDPLVRLIGRTAAPGASPFRFRGTVLIDWLRTKDPRSRALSVSRKDRGAILPLGRAHEHVYWYGYNGNFTTSTYYADTLPDWVERFNDRGLLRRYAGQAWTPLLPPSAYPEPDSVAVENGGRDFTFPHVLSADSTRESSEITEFPWMDQATLDLALDGVQALGLGAGPATDVLAVSLSTTDAVGHKYGMDSRELHDQVLRLDRSLGAFLDSLYKLRDSSRVVVALTADHGMAPYPELHFPGTDPRRGRAAVEPVLRTHRARLASRGVDTSTALDFEGGMLLLDRDAFATTGVDPDSAVHALVADLRRVPGVLRVDERAALAGEAARGDKYARRWLHSIPDNLPAAAVVTLQPYYYWSTTSYATHGSPQDYDTHVPVIFYGPGIRPGKYGSFVRVVDMAPTLAALTHTLPTEPLDGQVLRDALR